MAQEAEPIGPNLPEGNHISQLGISTPDLEPRLSEILIDVAPMLQNNFHPQTNNQRQPIIEYSRWWGEKAGAARIRGNYVVNGIEKSAILRIEGAHIPAPDEWMLPHVKREFAVDDNFVVPDVLWAQPWTEEQDGYSASIIEAIDDTTPLFTIPPDEQQLTHFYDVWQKYRAVINNENFQPWIAKPPDGLAASVQKAFKNWGERQEVVDDFATRPADKKLIDNALGALQKGYENIEPVFMHTHFGKDDIVEKDGKYIFRANLYWDWKAPFYDAVFGYHWAMLELANNLSIPENQLLQRLEEVRTLWRSQLDQLVPPEQQKLLQLALLERAAAGLLQDVSLVYGEPSLRRDIAKDFERNQINELLQELQAA